MSILENAIDSISLSLEDHNNDDSKRVLSSIRNLHAGILLLYKEKLLRLSPTDSNEVFIKAKTVPRLNLDGTVSFIGDGRKTVDVQQIKDRFKKLGITTEWERFDRVSSIRNEVEHYFSRTNRDVIRGVIADVFIIIRDFIRDELREDPLQLLGAACWNQLLEISEVYNAEKAECEKLMSSIEFPDPELERILESFTCHECGSELLIPVNPDDDIISINIKCKSCGEEFSLTDRIEEEVLNNYGVSDYKIHTEGASQNVTACPNCDRQTFVLELGRCLLCNETSDTECPICGNTLGESELFEGFCTYCDEQIHDDD